MNRNACIFCFLVFTLAVWSGCSSKPTADEAKKAAIKLDRIQGKAQVLIEGGGAMDAAMNAGSTLLCTFGKARAATACSSRRPTR